MTYMESKYNWLQPTDRVRVANSELYIKIVCDSLNVD